MSYKATVPEDAVSVPSGSPLPWFQIWMRALTRPGAGTFSELANQSGAKAGSHCYKAVK